MWTPFLRAEPAAQVRTRLRRASTLGTLRAMPRPRPSRVGRQGTLSTFTAIGAPACTVRAEIGRKSFNVLKILARRKRPSGGVLSQHMAI